ncbi:MAG: O-acetyl-ADP-ribose deacetylase [Candidatus Omnitrophica bacterium]|nr:O-acetyl-ADP-ribose deacetylase [Candidatus Omnitrophota bacterium]
MNNIISVIRGDITKQVVEAIVNAANTSLRGGGGVDGAIHRAAGPQLLQECITLKGCPTGEARITRGYQLPAEWVIHTVGPIWRGGKAGEDERLRDCYIHCFEIVREKKIRSIAFPSVSTGAYRFPLERAVRIAITVTKECIAQCPHLEKVMFVCFDETTYEWYQHIVSEK